MLYGIQQNTLASPLSLIVSIVLFFGVVAIGDISQKFFLRKINYFKYDDYNIYFAPLIGAFLLIYPIYIILIFELKANIFLKFISYFLIIFGIINIYLKKNLYISIIKKFNFNCSLIIYLIILVYIFLFFISSSPITHADSIDYHFSGALDILRNSHFHKEILPMHNTLVSIGEIIIAIGLVVGAEQFGGIIQFSALLALIPIFFRKEQNKIFLLAILICPITLFLVSSPKPQLLFAISSFLIFVFLTSYFSKLTKSAMKTSFSIIIFILALNILAKHSFIVSSTILGIYATFLMIRKKLFLYSIFSILIVFTVTILPFWLFRYYNFATVLPDLIISPLPINVYGYQYFHNFLTGGSLSLLSIFFPSSLGKFTTTFGPMLILLILMINKKTIINKFPLIIIIIYILIATFFGSNLNRFLYEGFLWLVYLISLTYLKKSLIYKLFNKGTYIQSIIILPILIFFVITIFPGSLNEKFKIKVMTNTANGYELANWANNNLDRDDILLSTHRSISLFKNKTYSSIFLWGVDFSNQESLLYANYLKSKKINKIIFYGNKLNSKPFENCLGKLLHYKKNVGSQVGRNPFNKKDTYDGWIYDLNYKDMPKCLIYNK